MDGGPQYGTSLNGVRVGQFLDRSVPFPRTAHKAGFESALTNGRSLHRRAPVPGSLLHSSTAGYAASTIFFFFGFFGFQCFSRRLLFPD